jgi:hypothetical protein
MRASLNRTLEKPFGTERFSYGHLFRFWKQQRMPHRALLLANVAPLAAILERYADAFAGNHHIKYRPRNTRTSCPVASAMSARLPLVAARPPSAPRADKAVFLCVD